MKRHGSKPHKPLASIEAPLRAKAYRAKFRPLETTKFLDVSALKRARKAKIEVGTLEFAGMSQLVAAEIDGGMVVALKPLGCECGGSKVSTGTRGKTSIAAVKQTIRLMHKELKRGGHAPPPPVPVAISARAGIRIPIGPIVIVLGEPPIGVDLCLDVTFGRLHCWECIFGPSGCEILDDF